MRIRWGPASSACSFALTCAHCHISQLFCIADSGKACEAAVESLQLRHLPLPISSRGRRKRHRSTRCGDSDRKRKQSIFGRRSLGTSEAMTVHPQQASPSGGKDRSRDHAVLWHQAMAIVLLWLRLLQHYQAQQQHPIRPACDPA